jgi:hypothetical protein
MGYSIDGATKIISLTAGTIEVSVKDLWSRWVDWFLTSDNSKYLPAFTQVGGNDVDLSAGTSIPIYIFLENGWKVKPQEADHTLAITEGILLVNGGGDPFMNTTGAFIVRINYQQPVQAITVSTGGGGGLTASQTRDALGMASANLDSQLGAIAGYVDSEVGAIKAKTDQLTFTVPNQVDSNALSGGGGGSAEDIATAVWAQYLESGVSSADLLKIMVSVLAGKTTIANLGGGVATLTFRDITDTRDAVTISMNNSERTISSHNP